LRNLLARPESLLRKPSDRAAAAAAVLLAAAVRMTRLPIQSTQDETVDWMALSGDGSELAVVSGNSAPYALRVYSVASGRLKHAWSAPVRAGVSDLSWVGDSVVGFDVIYAPNIHEDSARVQQVSARGHPRRVLPAVPQRERADGGVCQLHPLGTRPAPFSGMASLRGRDADETPRSR
jgi:hypothetical protein